MTSSKVLGAMTDALHEYGDDRDWQKMRPDEMAEIALAAAETVRLGQAAAYPDLPEEARQLLGEVVECVIVARGQMVARNYGAAEHQLLAALKLLPQGGGWPALEEDRPPEPTPPRTYPC